MTAKTIFALSGSLASASACQRSWSHDSPARLPFFGSWEEGAIRFMGIRSRRCHTQQTRSSNIDTSSEQRATGKAATTVAAAANFDPAPHSLALRHHHRGGYFQGDSSWGCCRQFACLHFAVATILIHFSHDCSSSSGSSTMRSCSCSGSCCCKCFVFRVLCSIVQWLWLSVSRSCGQVIDHAMLHFMLYAL